MNPMQQNKPTPKQKPPKTDNSAPGRSPSEQEDEGQSAEEIRHSSQTAQDREHTIRSGDNVTTQTKEFPS